MPIKKNCNLLLYIMMSLFSSAHATDVGEISPSITTPHIEPKQPDTEGPDITIPLPIIKTIPDSADQYKFILRRLDIEGAFGELAANLPQFYSNYINQEITVVDLFNIALAIQNAYHKAGYFLVQVFVPAQTIEEGIARIVISEAYISDVDVSALPERYQKKAAAIFSSLLNAQHILRQEIERKLLLVNNLAGLTIETTLIPGKEPRSTVLIVDGRSRLVSGYLIIDNYASPPLKEWEGLVSLSLNSPAGQGEEFIFQGTFHPSLHEIGRDQPIKASGQLAAFIPLGNNGWSLNADVIRSITHPKGKLTSLHLRGRLNDWSVGLSYPYILSRRNTLDIDGKFEYIDEVLQTDLAGPRITLSHDSLRVLRFGATWSHKKENGFQSILNGRISQGLNVLGAREDPASGAGLSRANGEADFTKLEAYTRLHFPLTQILSFEFSAKGQWSPDILLVPEQFTLGGPDFGSAQYIGAVLGDYGFGTRGELQHYIPINSADLFFGIQPYLFADYGRAYLKNPTVAEEKFTSVASTGAGLRFSTFHDIENNRSLHAFLEYARQLDGPPGEDNGNKLSLTLTIGF